MQNVTLLTLIHRIKNVRIQNILMQEINNNHVYGLTFENTIKDLFKLDYADFRFIRGFGKKSVNTLFNEIRKIIAESGFLSQETVNHYSDNYRFFCAVKNKLNNVDIYEVTKKRK